MEIDAVRALIEAGLDQCEAHVEGDGRHFEAVVICPAFQGKSMVRQHRMVYAAVKEQMDSGLLHALSLRTFTPETWAARKG